MGDSSETSITYGPLRNPDPNEKRLIARHVCKFYTNLLVAGIYSFPQVTSQLNVDTSDLFKYFQSALHECVRAHPSLSVVVKNPARKDVRYARCSQVNLRDHFNTINAEDLPNPVGLANDDTLIRNAISHILNSSDLTFFNTVESCPPWRLDVLPLEWTDHLRLFVSFTYCHVIGDGMSGIAFHKTLLRAMNNGHTDDNERVDFVTTSAAPLPSLPRLSISISYLVAPALGLYLPKFIRDLTGFKASVSGADENTWTGSETFVGDGICLAETALEVLSVDAKTLAAVLKVCREHQTKLTSVLNEIIARCWSSQHLIATKASNPKPVKFVSSTPNNLRKAAGISDSVIGNLSSTVYGTHQFYPQQHADSTEIAIDELFWEETRKGTQNLAAGTSTLHNQAIGLLKFISDINGWMKSQVGHTRDGSWQLSNLMSFDGRSSGADVMIEKMYFSQPADTVGLPLNFNTVSTQGGDLVICITWQPGSFGFCPIENAKDIESDVVRAIINDMKGYLNAIAQG